MCAIPEKLDYQADWGTEEVLKWESGYGIHLYYRGQGREAWCPIQRLGACRAHWLHLLMIEAWNKTYPEPGKPTMYKFTTIMILLARQHVLKILDPENARPVTGRRLAHYIGAHEGWLHGLAWQRTRCVNGNRASSERVWDISPSHPCHNLGQGSMALLVPHQLLLLSM